MSEQDLVADGPPVGIVGAGPVDYPTRSGTEAMPAQAAGKG